MEYRSQGAPALAPMLPPDCCFRCFSLTLLTAGLDCCCCCCALRRPDVRQGSSLQLAEGAAEGVALPTKEAASRAARFFMLSCKIFSRLTAVLSAL
eukprot:6171952-Pleurochrysis_carterae.AAC.1